MNTSRELHIISMLQKESEESYSHPWHAGKAQQRSTSEISAWNDKTFEIALSHNQHKIKAKNTPSRNYFCKNKYPSPVAQPKPTKLILPIENPYYNPPESYLKLPMIRGTKSPMYRYAPFENKYTEKDEGKYKNDNKKESDCRASYQFSPRSIKSIKNPFQVTSLFNNEILRSLSSTKKNQYISDDRGIL